MSQILQIPEFDLPNAKRDTPRTFVAKKQRVLGRLTPLSLVHPATANTLIIMGAKAKFMSRKSDAPDHHENHAHDDGSHQAANQGRDGHEHHSPPMTCSFPLNYYLMFAGTAALSLYVLGVISQHLVRWIISTGLRKGDSYLLKALEVFAKVIALLEIFCIFVMTFVLFPKLFDIQWDDPSKENYCDYELIMFSAIFFTTMWFVVVFGAMGFVYLQCVRNVQKQPSLHEAEDQNWLSIV